MFRKFVTNSLEGNYAVTLMDVGSY